MKPLFFVVLICFSSVGFSQIEPLEAEVVNQSLLKVDTLYYGYDLEKAPLKFETELFHLRKNSWKPLKKSNLIVLSFKESKPYAQEIHIYSEKTIIKNKFRSAGPFDSIKTIDYRSNLRFVQDSMPIWDSLGNITYADLGEEGETLIATYYTTEHKMEIGDVFVTQHDEKCMDTGCNSLVIKTKNGDLQLKYLDNVKFFEEDLNQDGKPELYILTFACCIGKLNVFKIE